MNINKVNGIHTINIVAIIMQFMFLIGLPSFTKPGIIINIILLVLSGTLNIVYAKAYKNLNTYWSYILSILQTICVWLPLGLLSAVYLDSNYEKVTESSDIKVQRLNMIKTIVPLMMIIQYALFSASIFNPSTNLFYLLILVSILNIFLIGLLWREVNFYITDG